MAEENKQVQGEEGEVNEEGQPIIPGTNYKTPEEAAKGFENLKALSDRQGNELGQLRKQLEETQGTISQMQQSQTKSQAEQGPDYEAEVSKIYEQMESLDPMDDGFSKSIVKLTKQANSLEAKAAEQRALNAAAEKFQQQLSERDQQESYRQFYEANPDFQAPEMQAKIKDYLAKDRTGLSDPLVAYREVQRDEAMAKAAEFEEKLAEASRLLELKQGKNETGKVVSGHSSGTKQKQPKLKGADLDAAMRDSLASV